MQTHIPLKTGFIQGKQKVLDLLMGYTSKDVGERFYTQSTLD